MKTEIHPKYEKTVIKCACGNEFETRSTLFPEIHTELCSACHPFYTGKQKFIDTAGRVDKFRARVIAASSAKTKSQTSENKSIDKQGKTNQEKLAEIKSTIEKPSQNKNDMTKPTTVTQEMSSDVEVAGVGTLEKSAESDK